MKKAWIYLFIATILAASGLMADWDPQDGHKMHYPQLPDPKGWDVCLRPMAIADDFMCRQSGPITDIHFWVSWKDDYIRQTPAWDIAIYSDGNGTPGKPPLQDADYPPLRSTITQAGSALLSRCRKR